MVFIFWYLLFNILNADSKATTINFCSVPPEVYVASLERKHAQLVYETWKANRYSVVEDVADDIELFPSIGVFLKTTGELVSWSTSLAGNGISRLYTLEQHRHKGYAALAVKAMAKTMALNGQMPFATVVVSNEGSSRLFERLGFRRLHDGHTYCTLLRWRHTTHLTPDFIVKSLKWLKAWINCWRWIYDFGASLWPGCWVISPMNLGRPA